MNADPLDSMTFDVATGVLDHMDTMYPAALQAVPSSARVSIRNTIRSQVRRAIIQDREQRAKNEQAARKVPLTAKQLAGLTFIKAFIAENDRSPSYTEIGEALGLKGRGNVSRLVHCLVERGHLRLTQRFKRSIEVLE